MSRSRLPDMRLVPETGALVLAHPVLPYGEDPPWLDHNSSDGRSHRTRLLEAQVALDRLGNGRVPPEGELAVAPILDHWALIAMADGLSLVGRVAGHPNIRPDRITTTSPLIAIDSRHAAWARTVSRWYRLGRPDGTELSS